jgi:peptidoglycan/LPS O-acetylase OafA/YrhL
MNRATSLYLDIIRPLAAFIVLFSHVSDDNLTGGQLKFMSATGVQAVDVFFVLSGFVIAHVCATREQDARSYVISRAARIYSVAIPTLILTMVLDFIGRREDMATYLGPYQAFSPGVIVRSVLFLGEQWNAHRFPGSDGPYWSLGFEVWYYVAFGVFLFCSPRWRWVAAAGVLIFIGPKVALMFPAWLMGVLAYRICKASPFSAPVGWWLFLVPIVLIAVYEMLPHSGLQAFANVALQPMRLLTTAQDYFLAALFSVHIVGFATVSKTFAPWLEKRAHIIRWIAGGTFSLYLVHLPIMHILSASSPWPKTSPMRLGFLLICTPLLAYLFAQVSERRKDVWHRLIERLLRFLARRLPFVLERSYTGGQRE